MTLSVAGLVRAVAVAANVSEALAAEVVESILQDCKTEDCTSPGTVHHHHHHAALSRRLSPLACRCRHTP